MGQTFSLIKAKVSDTVPMYRLWEQAQFVELLSRTHSAKDMWLVREPKETAQILWKVLKHTTQYTTHICSLLDSIMKGGDVTRNGILIIDQLHHPFHLIHVLLPQDNSGCSYLLVSCKNSMVTYIGEMGNLPECIEAHNTGCGSHQMQSCYLHPWAILAYVVGFGFSIQKKKEFKSQWKIRKWNEEKKHWWLEPEEIIHVDTCIIIDQKCHDPN